MFPCLCEQGQKQYDFRIAGGLVAQDDRRAGFSEAQLPSSCRPVVSSPPILGPVYQNEPYPKIGQVTKGGCSRENEGKYLIVFSDRISTSEQTQAQITQKCDCRACVKRIATVYLRGSKGGGFFLCLLTKKQK